MSMISDNSQNLNIYDEELNNETICDCSSQALCEVPEIKNCNILCVLYLQNNKITRLPNNFFPSLPSLMWLDVRDNLLTDIPTTIKNHPTLTHFLLQNNKITSLPNELGTVTTLKVLQLTGNPLMYPPREVIKAGVSKTKEFLYMQLTNSAFDRSQTELSEEDSAESVSLNDRNKFGSNHDGLSYNSVLDDELKTKVSIKFNDKDSDDSDYEHYGKFKGKCPKLAKSRGKTPGNHTQSSKYLMPLRLNNPEEQDEKIKRNHLKDLATQRHKELLAVRDKILQDRKNVELLKHWRKNYRHKQLLTNGGYKMDPQNFPYDTNPDFTTMLNREDIEKDLPDKFKKNLVRRCKPTVPRKSNNDVHLALKIKQLFDNLEAIDLNKQGLTPRTEQKMLLSEIQKISEIKQKLQELSTTNVRSVVAD